MHGLSWTPLNIDDGAAVVMVDRLQVGDCWGYVGNLGVIRCGACLGVWNNCNPYWANY